MHSDLQATCLAMALAVSASKISALVTPGQMATTRIPQGTINTLNNKEEQLPLNGSTPIGDLGRDLRRQSHNSELAGDVTRPSAERFTRREA